MIDTTGPDPSTKLPSPIGDPRWDMIAEQQLRDYFEQRNPELTLRTFDEAANALRERLHGATKCDASKREDTKREEILSSTRQRYGILDYQKLNWLSTSYLKWSKSQSSDADSTVLSFRPADGADASQPSHWREYLLAPRTPMAGASDDELATVFDVLGLLAQRRTLLSASAQRRLYRIALPWGRVRFRCRGDSESRVYLLVPVLTLFGAGRTKQFRRTISLTLFLIPRDADPRPLLTTFDLARLCQQSVWLPRRPVLPTLVQRPETDSMWPIAGELATFIGAVMPDEPQYLSEIFDAVMRRSLGVLRVVRATTANESTADAQRADEGYAERVCARIAVSRMRSAIFGASLHFESAQPVSVWKQLVSATDERRGDILGSILSVNAGRAGRESFIDGGALQLQRMRVTNAFEEDTNKLALYNPMSRFMLNVMPPEKSGPSTVVSLAFGVAWLNLLAGTVCTVKEILRSYRHEIEVHRTDVMIGLRASNERNRRRKEHETPEKPYVSTPEEIKEEADFEHYLRDLHLKMLAIREEVDVVYGLELVGQAYKAAYARMLEMENIPRERDRLLGELEMTAALLRAEQADDLSGKIAASAAATKNLNEQIAASTRATEETNVKIAESTDSTDRLTNLVLLLTFVAVVLATIPGIDHLTDDFTIRKIVTISALSVAAVVVAVVGILVIQTRKRRPPADRK